MRLSTISGWLSVLTVAAAGVAAAGEGGPKDLPARNNTARALSCVGKAAEPAVSELLCALGNKFCASVARFFPAKALGNIGGPAVPGLVKALGKGDTVGRANAAQALGWIGPEARKAVPALIERLWSDQARRVRGRAALALTALQEAAADEDHVLSVGAAEVIRRLQRR